MKVRDLLKQLAAHGWVVVRQTGSHRQLRHPHIPGTVTVAGTPSDDVHPKTLARSLKAAGLRKEDL